MNIQKHVIRLYHQTATHLAPDVARALRAAYKKESNKRGKQALGVILENIELGGKLKRPLCQDTGTPLFYVSYNPKKYTQKYLTRAIRAATKIATKKVPLRPNAVNPVTNENIGNEPVIYFSEGRGLEIELYMKGGGSENVGQIYSLPHTGLKAERDFTGVEKCVLDAVKKAGGKACPPYIVGIAVGSGMSEVMSLAKKQLLRSVTDKNSAKFLAKLERDWLVKINKLNIGPVGMGGKTTALSVKLGVMPRHPACYFVAVSFACWCMRHSKVIIK